MSKFETLIKFYEKQLEDRDGIISRSADLDPANPGWLVKDIEDRLDKAKAQASGN
jgi:hypothetical protein